MAEYLKVILHARETLGHTLLEGEIVTDGGILKSESSSATVFRNAKTGVRSIVVLNSEPEAATIEISDFTGRPAGRVGVWVPTSGVTNASLPVRMELPGRMLAIVTEEEAAKQLGAMAHWKAPTRNRKVVFDMASSEDLKGWKLEGCAFSVSARPEIQFTSSSVC